MTDLKVAKLNKWPFLTGDLLLLLAAGGIMWLSVHPLGTWSVLGITALTLVGAWISVIPFVMEYRAAVKVSEASALTTVVEQINDLRTLANQISFATAQWQVVQDQASQTVKASHEIAERMEREATSFTAFMQKANDTEKNHLRLEVDKLRRGESEWLQSAVRLLDHVYALHQAGLRSGQQVLIEQLGQFQSACRESMRRVGLTPFEAKLDELFNSQTHQLMEGNGEPPEGARIRQTLAPGYTYQGQVVRAAVVNVEDVESGAQTPTP